MTLPERRFLNRHFVLSQAMPRTEDARLTTGAVIL